MKAENVPRAGAHTFIRVPRWSAWGSRLRMDWSIQTKKNEVLVSSVEISSKGTKGEGPGPKDL